MKEIINNIINQFEHNSTKLYLILSNVFLIVFGIWFANIGMLPFLHVSDFFVFALLTFILALYRPSWMFAFFVGTLVLENINIGWKNFGITLRPYQFFGFITLISLFVRFLFGRLLFKMPKFKWPDALVFLFVLGSFLSSFSSLHKAISLKQAFVALSFAALYYLTRIYIQSWDDLKRIAPFFLSASVVELAYGILQNIRFLHGYNSYEVMPGRPNGTFSEPDWFGIYLVMLLATTLAMRISKLEKIKISLKRILEIVFLILIFIVLILTVSRSAWLGSIILLIAFLKIVLLNNSFKFSKWNWKNFLMEVAIILVALGIASGLSMMVTRFQIANRAQSTGGLQKITIACQPNHSNVPNHITDISELSQYGCKHINLEDIDQEKAQGNEVVEIYRNDPTVGIRGQIYQKSLSQIKQHPILGIGWGSISFILGSDERGAGLNASNIFLETYLGSGILGFASLVVLLLWILSKTILQFLKFKPQERAMLSFILFGWIAIVVPNFFNSGIFLGFLWVYFSIATTLLIKHK